MTVERTLESIPKMNDEGLMQLFRNALAKRQNANAQAVKKAVEDEWGRRLSRARAGTYAVATPKKGMLDAFGYHVGESHKISTNDRRQILHHLMEGQLPLVSSPAYTDQWGTPLSIERFSKLVGTLQNLCNSNASAKAQSEWRSDIDWIAATYGYLASTPTSL